MDASDTTARHGGSIPMAGWMREGVLLGMPPPMPEHSGGGGVLEKSCRSSSSAASTPWGCRALGRGCQTSAVHGEAAKELIKGAAHYPRPPSNTAVLGNETL